MSYQLRWPRSSRQETSIELHAVNTELRLQFFGGRATPTGIYSQNMFDWYALYTPQMQICAVDAHGKEGGHASTSTNWTIVVVFNKPATFSRLIVSFSNPGFPQFEVKRATRRSAMICIFGDIPAGILNIYAKP